MIIYNLKKINHFSKKNIKEYENIQNFNISRCPNCHSYELIKWGKYLRNVIYYKNGKKYENTIEIKRIKCKHCNKTQSIIPSFLVPYKIHVTEYITEVIKRKIVTNVTYNLVCKKYQISRQLLKFWLGCFQEHFTRISVMMCNKSKKNLIKEIHNSLYEFIYEYYQKNRKIYMMYVTDNLNEPILKWAPT